jgi:hypothetical protein
MTDADTEGTKILKSILKDKYDQLNLEGLTPKQQYMAILKSIRQANDEDFINTYIDNAEKLDKYPELKKMFMDTITENPTMLNKFAGEQITEVLKDFDTSYIQKALIAKAESMGIAKDKYDVFIGKVIESIKNPNDPFFKSAGDEFQKQIIKATYKINPDGAYIPNPDKAKDIAKLFEERYDFVATKAGTVPDNTWTGKMLQSLKDGGKIDPNADIKVPAPYSGETDLPIVKPDGPVPAAPEPAAPTNATAQTEKLPTDNQSKPANSTTDNDAVDEVKKNIAEMNTEELKSEITKEYKSLSTNDKVALKRVLINLKELNLGNLNELTSTDKQVLNSTNVFKYLKALSNSSNYKDNYENIIDNMVKSMPDPTQHVSSYQYASKDEEFLFNEYFKFENKLNKFKK